MWRDGAEFWNERVNSVMVSEGASRRQLSRDLMKLILSRTRALSGRAMMDRRPSALGPISLRPSKPSQDQAVLYEQGSDVCDGGGPYANAERLQAGDDARGRVTGSERGLADGRRRWSTPC